MMRLLLPTLLCVLGTAQGYAQREVSLHLLELADDERNAAFTLMLRDSNRKCNQVIRTLFKGTILGVDEWEALCKDRNSYSVSVLADPDDDMITVTSLSCRELLATSKMLLHRAGSKSRPSGCSNEGATSNGNAWFAERSRRWTRGTKCAQSRQ